MTEDDENVSGVKTNSCLDRSRDITSGPRDCPVPDSEAAELMKLMK